MAFQPPAFLYGALEAPAPMHWSAADCSQLLAAAAAAAAAAASAGSTDPSSPTASDSDSSTSSTSPFAAATPNTTLGPAAHHQAHEQLASALLLHHHQQHQQQQQQHQHHLHQHHRHHQQDRLNTTHIADYNRMISNQRTKQQLDVQQAQQHNTNTHQHNDTPHRHQATPERLDADHQRPHSEPHPVHDQQLNEEQLQHHHDQHQTTNGPNHGRPTSDLNAPNTSSGSPYSFVDDEDDDQDDQDDDQDCTMSILDHHERLPNVPADRQLAATHLDQEDDEASVDVEHEQEFALNLSLRNRDLELSEQSESGLRLTTGASLLLDSTTYESQLKRTLEHYRHQANGARGLMTDPGELLASLAEPNQQQQHLNHIQDKSYHRRLALLAGAKCVAALDNNALQLNNNYINHQSSGPRHQQQQLAAGSTGPNGSGAGSSGSAAQARAANMLLGHSLNGSSAASSCSSSASSSASSSSFCSNGWSSPERASISSPISSSAASLISAAAAASVVNCSRLGGASCSSSSTSAPGGSAEGLAAGPSQHQATISSSSPAHQLHRSLFVNNFTGPTGQLDANNNNNNNQHHQSTAGHLRPHLVNPHQLDQGPSNRDRSLGYHLQAQLHNTSHQHQQHQEQVHKADSEDLNRIRSFIEQFKARRGALGLTQKQAAQCFRAFTNDRYAFSDNFVGHFEGFQFRPQTAMTIADSLAEWLEFAENETRQGRQLSFMPGKVKETRKRKYEVIRIRDSAKRVLVEAFEKNRSPSTSELEQLSKKTNIPSRNIEIFFKNRRTSRQYHQ